MEQEKEFQKLFQKLTSDYLERLPAFAEITTLLITMKMRERIAMLKILLRWLERYKEPFRIVDIRNIGPSTISQVYGKDVPFSVRYAITARYTCQDCEKDSVSISSPIVEDGNFGLDVGTDQNPHLVCADCYYRNYYEPDYEPDPDPHEEFPPSELSDLPEIIDPVEPIEKESSFVKEHEEKDRKAK